MLGKIIARRSVIQDRLFLRGNFAMTPLATKVRMVWSSCKLVALAIASQKAMSASVEIP